MRSRVARVVAGLGLIALGGCTPETPARHAPLLVVGIDGGERRVIEKLWSRGDLPTLARLRDSGSFLPLETAYGVSPVIWTTIATGVRPSEHGITDFAVPTESGDIPASSELRRRPALWDMTSKVRRPTAVLGWWATWPAESIDGAVISDRIDTGLDRTFSPPSLSPEVGRWLTDARQGGGNFGGNEASQLRDRVVARAARELVRRDYELVLAYFRSVDLVSHDFWHRFAPEDFPDGPPAGAAESPLPDPVSDAYRAFDSALGEILAAAPLGTSVLVLSDHGFQAENRHSLQLLLDLDTVLKKLGWEKTAADGGVDQENSRAWVHASPSYKQTKLIRFRPGLDARAALRDLTRDLERARFAGGRTAFEARLPTPAQRKKGADAVVAIRADNATPLLFVDREPLPEAILHLGRITGGHGPRTRGILFASGPIFRPGVTAAAISIHDMAPTILYALGLPVAEDFSGQAALDLFRPEFRAAHPLRKIASWGARDARGPVASSEDRRLMEELGALGYLR